MNNIPIKIDLSIFFDDERQKVMLMFNPDWKTVGCLQQRVETLFGLDSVRFLSDDGCFIPPQEPIEVVKFSSDLKAFIHNDTFQKKKSKNDRKSKATISESESGAIVEKGCSIEADAFNKKRKYRSLDIGFDSSPPNRAKRIKNDDRLNSTLVHNTQHAHKSSEISSTSEQMPPPLQPPPASSHSLSIVKKSKSKKKQCSVSSPTTVNESNDERTVSEQYSSTKEDIQNESRLKHSLSPVAQAKSINEGVEDVATIPARPTSLPSSTFRNESKTLKKKKRSANTNNPFKNSIPNTKHLYYDESGEITTTTATVNSPDKIEVEEETKISFHCALNDTDAKKPRIFQIQTNKLGPQFCNKADIEIQENIVLSPMDIQIILNKSQISQDEMEEERGAKSLLLSPVNSPKEIDKPDLKTPEDHNSDDEGNCSLNESNITSSTSIDKYKETSMDVSTKLQTTETNGDESSNKQTDQTNGDDVSMDKTSNSEASEISIIKHVNESSVVSVDCVDLSIDLDDDDDDVCKAESDTKSIKKHQDVSNYDSSDVEEISEVIDLNETEEANISSISFGSKSKYSDIKLGKILAFCTKLTQLPEIGDVVVFKVPYVSRKGATCSTEFLAGEAEYINKRTKSIKLLILDGHSELCYVPGKFFNNLDNSLCGQKFIQMKYSDMIDPKIWRKNKS